MKQKENNNLLAVNPKLAREWHPTKNGDLTPEKIAPWSRKKVWWLCKNGHDWKTYVKNRNRGNGCPYCAGKIASVENNLAVDNPKLAREWHPTKNGDLTPEKIAPRSGKKVWWLCKNGHEWKIDVSNRNKGNGCPYCAGKIASVENNFAVDKPELAKEWHPTKNGDLTPEKVTPGSSKKVWWLCKNGHEWKTYVFNRRQGYNCPYCMGVRASKIYNLKMLAPELIKEWHPTKNGDLIPEKVTPGSNKKVWWLCKNGHEWQAGIGPRYKGSGCPYCCGRIATPKHNLAIDNPLLAKEWHPVKNGNLTPEHITPGSNKKVWWVCKKGHEWQATPATRNNKGTGCPYCSGRRPTAEYNLKVVNPEAAKQWHPTKNGNLTPEKIAPGSGKKVWWLCKRGHEWQELVYRRNRAKSCPYCSGRRVSAGYNLHVVNPELAKEWHPVKNGNLTPEIITPGSNKKVWWLCKNGHEWQATPAARNRNGTGCPYCSGRRPTAEYNLKVVNPGLAKEWHPTKNGKLRPGDISPYSGKKAWWVCEKEHEWQAIIADRNYGRGCPVCYFNKIKLNIREDLVPEGFKGKYKPRVYLHRKRPYVGTRMKVTVIEKGIPVKKNKIVSYARYIYGLDRIPEDHVIWHIDGDSLNNAIENLECITKEESYIRMREVSLQSRLRL